MKGGNGYENMIYQHRRDPDYFRVRGCERHDLPKMRDISGKEQFTFWRKSKLNTVFLTGLLVLCEAEPLSRKVYRKALAAAGARKITLGNKRPRHYLIKVVKQYHTPARAEKPGRSEAQQQQSALRRKKADGKKGRIVMEFLNNIIGPLKKQWGYDTGPPSREVFEITAFEISELEISTNARIYLMAQVASGPIGRERFKLIMKEVKRLFPNDGPEVIAALAAGRKLEPFAVIATPEVAGTSTVAVVAAHGSFVRMEAHKFVRMIETPDVPQDLGTIGDRRGGLETPLACGNHTGVRLVGKMVSSSWRLLIGVIDARKDELKVSHEFILDMDFVVLLCEVLKRLRRDEEVYRRWREDAMMTVAGSDPFATR